MPETKMCIKCKTEKPIAAFRKDGKTPKGTVRRRSQCRACFSSGKRQFRNKDENGCVVRRTHCEACGAKLNGQWFTCSDKCRMLLADRKKAAEEREFREWERRLIELRDKPRKLLEARKRNEGSQRVPPKRVSRGGALPLLRDQVPRS